MGKHSLHEPDEGQVKRDDGASAPSGARGRHLREQGQESQVVPKIAEMDAHRRGGEEPPGGAAAVAARGLVVRRSGHEVLKGLDFEIPAGQITGLLGPSGCGKSTLMRAVVGVQAHVDGELDVLGKPAGSAELREQIGYVTQAASVYPDLTATENLRFFAKVVGAKSGSIDDALKAVDLHERSDQLVRDMSGGQRSRVSLAVALLSTPKLLVLDEPTVGLDPVLRVDLWALFRRLADGGVTLLVSSHVMDEAEHCDRLLLMRDGELVADTTPQRIKAETGCDTVESAFLQVVQR